MSNINDSILADFEMDEGLSMPVANTKNKELEQQIIKKQSSLTTSQSDLVETEDRVNALEDHLKNMRQELQNAQGLAAARDKELETELHLLKLTQREKGHLRQNVTRLMKEMDELNTKNHAFKSNILLQTQKMKQIQSDMNLNQQALEAWLEESAKKDEDVTAIQKYTRQDEVTIKELSHSEEKLIASILQKKHNLNIEVINTLASQIELDKTAENFRNAHLDREQLLLQWENMIDLMQNRDRQMDVLADKLSETKKEVYHNNKIMRNKLKFLKLARENNNDTEKKISVAERTNILLKKEVSETEENKVQFEHETEMLHLTLERSALDLELARSSVTQVKMQIIEKINKLQQVKELRQSLDSKLKAVVETTLNVGEQATAMDDLFIAEEKKQETLRIEQKLIENLLCKAQQEERTAQADYRIIEVSVNCGHNVIKNLSSKTRRLDNHTLKQQEILYSQNLNLLQLEKRCFHMQGDSNSEDKAALEDKASERLRDLENLNQSNAILVAQYRKVQENCRHAQLDVDKFQAEKANLMIKIDDCNLYNIGLEAELKILIKKKQNLMVDENLMKLEIKKIQDLLNSHEDNILSSEMRKLQLDTALKERHHEIKNHKEMLAAKIKVAQEKIQQLTAELFERMSKVDMFKMKFKSIIMSMAQPNCDGETSQVYFLIKAAAEKDALQRVGDDLDVSIRKAEREIRALENTLNLMNGRNNLYKQSFQKLDESSDAMNKKHELDEQMKAVIDKYKYKKRQIKELQDEMHTVRATFDSLKKEEEAVKTIIVNKKEKVSLLEREIHEQREKLTRAAKQNSRNLRNLRLSRKHLEEIPEEKDIKIREIREFNKKLMAMIWEAAQTMELYQTVQLYFTEANLPSPATSNEKESSLSSATEESLSNLTQISDGQTLSQSLYGISDTSTSYPL